MSDWRAKGRSGPPYFDVLFDSLDRGDADVSRSLGHHVHFGYWDEPPAIRETGAGFERAAERLSWEMCQAGQVADGQRILDVGCGFGGTIAGIDERFRRMELVGLNIDAHQLARARSRVRPKGTNHIEFVEGNACDLNFDEDSFDVVLALECIFHFPSREGFFRQALRVLRPRGRLVLCDFVPSELIVPLLAGGKLLLDPFDRRHGRMDVTCTLHDYRRLARRSGLTPRLERDITFNTLPSYGHFRRMFPTLYSSLFDRVSLDAANRWLEWYAQQGLLRYMILGFDKPDCPGKPAGSSTPRPPTADRGSRQIGDEQ